MDTVKLVECPRDAMQGIHEFIPTETKIEYLEGLLKIGFNTIDIGSFVSPKAIPQLRDSSEVLNALDLTDTDSELLVIVANERGAKDACKHDMVDYLGYPFSISETFQQRNTNTDIAGSLERTRQIAELTSAHAKRMVVYISMAFGNPYGDPWDKDVALRWVDRLVNELGIGVIALADTVGVATPDDISYLFEALIPAFPEVEFGAHLHVRPDNWQSKVQAAWDAGCRRFDGALKGFGGCPMAEDDLVGNAATENLISFVEGQTTALELDKEALTDSLFAAGQVFPV